MNEGGGEISLANNFGGSRNLQGRIKDGFARNVDEN
jgi:hypothetical protein